jgi:hypothetical protein
MEIILKEQHVKELENFANELPTKFGAPLLNFLNKLAPHPISNITLGFFSNKNSK